MAMAAFVWIWLADATKPVVAGRIDLDNGTHSYTYGRSYLAHTDAIPIITPNGLGSAARSHLSRRSCWPIHYGLRSAIRGRSRRFKNIATLTDQ
jgi:hypothetical protein